MAPQVEKTGAKTQGTTNPAMNGLKGEFRMRRHATMGLAVVLSALVSFSALAAGAKKKPATAAADAGAPDTAAPADSAAAATPASADAGAAVGSGAGTQSAVAGPTGTTTSAAPKAAMDGPTYAVRLRDLEARREQTSSGIKSVAATRASRSSRTRSCPAARRARGRRSSSTTKCRVPSASSGRLFVIDGTVQYNRQDD